MSHTEETEAYTLLPPRTPPYPAAATGGADTYFSMEKVGNTNAHDNLTTIFGKFIDGKFQQELCAFWRFEVDMEQFRKISEATFEFVPFTEGINFGAVTPTKIKGGFLKPQTSGTNDWQDSGGVGEWADDGDCPLPMWNDGANVDNTVFEGNNFAFAFPRYTGSPDPADKVTTGEGATLLALGTVVNDTDGLAGIGFVQQLQDYLDNNEALRGHTLSGSIPVLFCMYLDGPRGQHGMQNMRAQNFGGQFTTFLRVIHDWERLDSGAELASSTTLDADSVVLTVKPSGAELASATTLDADTLVRALSAAELESATALDAESVVFDPLAPTRDLCMASNVLDVPVESSTLDVPVSASTLDVAVKSSTMEVPVESSTLDVPVESSTLDVTVDE